MMNQDEEFIQKMFNFYGIELKKIEESKSKSPDFIYKKSEQTILLELKTKYDEQIFLDKRRDILQRDEMFEHSDILKYSNTYSGLNKNAYIQLEERKNQISANLCFIIFYAKEPNSIDKMEKYEVTIYGKKFLIPINTDEYKAKYCFYYDLNDFMRFKNVIDGAIITNGQQLRICLNSVSPNYEEVKKCDVVKIFDKGVNDPIELEKIKKIMLMPESINRKKKDEVKEYIKKEYKIEKFVEADFPSYTYESILKIEDLYR